MSFRRVLIAGGTGQVGLELGSAKWPSGYEVVGLASNELDITNTQSVTDVLKNGAWAAIVNCAAWTAVDNAEDNVAAAYLVNCQGAVLLAEAAKRYGIPLIHMSTDYVFDGALDRPYRETDRVAPLGVYGASKLAGEMGVSQANPRSVILRTAWVISARRTNFLKTMLRLGTQNHDVRVVADQLGCPTSAADIAKAIVCIAQRMIEDREAPTGVYHFVNAGEATWFELAKYIFETADTYGQPAPRVLPIRTQDFPVRARRPANSRLDTNKFTTDFGIVPQRWQDAVSAIVHTLMQSEVDEGIVR